MYTKDFRISIVCRKDIKAEASAEYKMSREADASHKNNQRGEKDGIFYRPRQRLCHWESTSHSLSLILSTAGQTE